ncbi:MAG: PaaI family thioesterase [Oscillospiraceae bacterium]|nr:PaaI family thioesterase [Oscillospiraceae bacterium]
MEERSLKESSMEVNRHNPFVRLVGVEIEEVAPDRSRLRLAIRPESLNPHGLVHGGALFTLADNAAGCAASTDGRAYVTQSGDIHFLRVQSSGTVVAESRVLHRGRSTVLVEVSLLGEEGKLMATASFSYFCVDGSEIDRGSPARAARRS